MYVKIMVLCCFTRPWAPENFLNHIKYSISIGKYSVRNVYVTLLSKCFWKVSIHHWLKKAFPSVSWVSMDFQRNAMELTNSKFRRQFFNAHNHIKVHRCFFLLILFSLNSLYQLICLEMDPWSIWISVLTDIWPKL